MKQGRKFEGFSCKALVLSLTLMGAAFSHAAPSTAKSGADLQGAFARVADTVITHEEYDAAYAIAARNKFFHNKVGGGEEVALLQRDVADKLVTRVLLLREAERRGIKADPAEIEGILQNYERRYANSEHWKNNRGQLLPGLKTKHEEQNVLEQLEKAVRTIDKLDAAEVRAFYEKNPDKFTEPEKTRVSVILLKVDPSSPVSVWEKAGLDAEALVNRLREGADFAALAKEFSNDAGSARHGGDMGYLHQGMLPDTAEEAIKKINPGEITPPLRLLQGAAIFRLLERTEPKLIPFETVKGRAEELLKRERSEAAWKAFLAEIKEKTPAQIDQTRFLPLSEESSARAVPK